MYQTPGKLPTTFTTNTKHLQEIRVFYDVNAKTDKFSYYVFVLVSTPCKQNSAQTGSSNEGEFTSKILG